MRARVRMALAAFAVIAEPLALVAAFFAGRAAHG